MDFKALIIINGSNLCHIIIKCITSVKKFKVLFVGDCKQINQNPYIKVIWSNQG